MIGVKLGMLLAGFGALSTGGLPLGEGFGPAVRGRPARAIGIICLDSFAVSFLAGSVLLPGRPAELVNVFWAGLPIETPILVPTLLVVAALFLAYRTSTSD